MNDYVAGGIGGAAGVLVGHPFDTTKVQMQIKVTSKSYTSTWVALRDISNVRFSQGYFRGLSFPLLSYGAVNSILFGTESYCMNYLNSNFQNMSPYTMSFITGCCSAPAQWILACPVENIKVILQSQIKFHHTENVHFFKGPLDCISHLNKTFGIFGLYRGGIAFMIRDVPTYAIYFSSYRFIKDQMEKLNTNRNINYLISGGIAGSISWFCTMPADIVKSQIQADYNNRKYTNYYSCVREIYKSGGVKSFFTGSVIACTRGFFVNAVTFLVLETVLRFLK